MSPVCPKDSPEHHMLLHDSITRITLDLIASESEIVTLKAEVERLRKDYKFYREDSFAKAEEIYALNTERLQRPLGK